MYRCNRMHLGTRLQIAAINASNIWRKLKTAVWLIIKERKRLQAFMNQHAAFMAIVATLPVGGMGIFSIGMFSLYRANSRTN